MRPFKSSLLQTWSLELSYFLGAMGCSNHLDVRNCNNPAEENNYADYVNLETTRRAIHVGDIPFGAQVRVREIYVKIAFNLSCISERRCL